MKPGVIRRVYALRCALCQNESTTDASSDREPASKAFRRLGWRKAKKYGWICPEHAKWFGAARWSEALLS